MPKQTWNLGRQSTIRQKWDRAASAPRSKRYTGDVQMTFDVEHPAIRRLVEEALSNRGGRRVVLSGALVIRAENLQVEPAPLQPGP